jgi:hypothetical protein
MSEGPPLGIPYEHPKLPLIIPYLHIDPPPYLNVVSPPYSNDQNIAPPPYSYVESDMNNIPSKKTTYLSVVISSG